MDAAYDFASLGIFSRFLIRHSETCWDFYRYDQKEKKLVPADCKTTDLERIPSDISEDMTEELKPHLGGPDLRTIPCDLQRIAGAFYHAGCMPSIRTEFRRSLSLIHTLSDKEVRRVLIAESNAAPCRAPAVYVHRQGGEFSADSQDHLLRKFFGVVMREPTESELLDENVRMLGTCLFHRMGELVGAILSKHFPGYVRPMTPAFMATMNQYQRFELADTFLEMVRGDWDLDRGRLKPDRQGVTVSPADALTILKAMPVAAHC